MAYSSKIDIRLPEVPLTNDPTIFPDMLELYNAIRTLVQYTDAYDRSNPENNSVVWNQLGFGTAFWTVAEYPVSKGDFVSVGPNGLRKLQAKLDYYPGDSGDAGNTANLGVARYGVSARLPQVWGVALTDTLAGQQGRIGIGDAILHVPGTNIGDILYVASDLDIKVGVAYGETAPDVRGSGDSGVYTNVANYAANSHSSPAAQRWRRIYVPVGYCVAPGAVYIQKPASSIQSDTPLTGYMYYITPPGVGEDSTVVVGTNGIAKPVCTRFRDIDWV